MAASLNVGVYQQRRSRLAASMEGAVAIIPTAPERVRSRDSHYPYRFDSYFYYLTGFREPEAVLVIVAGEKDGSGLYSLLSTGLSVPLRSASFGAVFSWTVM